MVLSMTDAERIQRAQLADMPLATIAAYLREQGYAVSDKPLEWWQYHHKDCGRPYRGCAPECPKDTFERTGLWTGPPVVRDHLPAGWPPLGDADLPFEEDGR